MKQVTFISFFRSLKLKLRNYKSIAMTNVKNKITEKFIKNGILEYFHKHNIISKSQFGFQEN